VNKFILFLCLLLTGCTVNIQKKDLDKVLPVGSTPELTRVTQVFTSIESTEDKLLIHKLFSGAGEYLNNCEELSTTGQFDPILGKVQSSYGWDREKYPELTDAVSEYLVSVGYQEPKQLNSESERQSFAKIFQDLAGATKYEQ
jgi:hypothetical protein|tara:strand:+ start:1128 stop:1556 length:429 start_codon:yes stop_codon:yes gene_type:complete